MRFFASSWKQVTGERGGEMGWGEGEIHDVVGGAAVASAGGAGADGADNTAASGCRGDGN